VSLRARLLVALAVVVLLSLVAGDVATYRWLRSVLLVRVDDQLQTDHRPIESALELGGPGGGPGQGGPGQGSSSCPTDALQQAAPGTFVEVRTPTGTVLCQQVAYGPGGNSSRPVLPSRITGFSTSLDPNEPVKYFDAPSTEGGAPFRVRASQLQNGNILVLAVSLADVTSTLHHLLWIELLVTGGSLILACVLGWWLVRIGLRPLSAIETTAGNIAQGGLGQRVPGESKRTEVGRLAGVLNVMLARIEGAFAVRDAKETELRRSEARMRRFVGDASHELRTPLAAVSAYAELFERGASQHPEDLPRVMSGIRTETSRMGHLVDDLLLLARMDEGRPMDMSAIELVGLAAEAVDAARAVGPQWTWRLEAQQPVEVQGDKARLRQVLDNLLGNVRAHTPPGTTATVRVATAGAEAVCEVADDGPGIDPATADRLFERFYRADASRSRASGGSGLGLSIVEAIVAGHRGSISARPGEDGGSVFTFRIPLPETSPAAGADGGPGGVTEAEADVSDVPEAGDKPGANSAAAPTATTL
jgi:two-component system OmpR family sensor kinase